jgi:hypothetical protein
MKCIYSAGYIPRSDVYVCIVLLYCVTVSDFICSCQPFILFYQMFAFIISETFLNRSMKTIFKESLNFVIAMFLKLLNY